MLAFLVRMFADRTRPCSQRLKLAEALQFAARRCGPSLTAHGALLIGAYLDALLELPPTRDHGSSLRLARSPAAAADAAAAVVSDALASGAPFPAAAVAEWALLRGSCLANLGEAVTVLGRAVAPFAPRLGSLSLGVLEHEGGGWATALRCRGPSSPGSAALMESAAPARRGAAFLVRALCLALGTEALRDASIFLRDALRVLRRASDDAEPDAAVRVHAQSALQVLDALAAAAIVGQNSTGATWSSRQLRVRVLDR